jgi:TPP-dependent 2-oxoacid decarboxylase
MVNFPAGVTRSNNAILPLATNGTGTLTALLAIAGASGNANLTIDVSGYYLPGAP